MQMEEAAPAVQEMPAVTSGVRTVFAVSYTHLDVYKRQSSG